jgi:hypothetical protein
MGAIMNGGRSAQHRPVSKVRAALLEKNGEIEFDEIHRVRRAF